MQIKLNKHRATYISLAEPDTNFCDSDSLIFNKHRTSTSPSYVDQIKRILLAFDLTEQKINIRQCTKLDINMIVNRCARNIEYSDSIDTWSFSVRVYCTDDDYLDKITYNNRDQYLNNCIYEVAVGTYYKNYVSEGYSADFLFLNNADIFPNIDYSKRYLVVELYEFVKASGTATNEESYWRYVEVDSSSIGLTAEVVETNPKVEIVFPQNISVKSSQDIIVSWTYDNVYSEQATYEIGWSNDNGITWNTNTAIGATTYCNIGTLPVGDVLLRLRVTDELDVTSEYVYSSFLVYGETSAPVITTATSVEVPTITWEANYQDCWNIRIKNLEGTILYDTGLQIGADIRTHTCNTVLGYGLYIAEIRMLSIYGYFSEWTQYPFVVGGTTGSSNMNMTLSIDNDMGIYIDADIDADGEYLLIRKCDEVDSIITKFVGTYKDYKVALGKVYEYAIRKISRSSDTISIMSLWQTVNFGIKNEVILHDTENYENYVHFKYGEDDIKVIRSDTPTKTYHQVIGRREPIISRVDWNVSVRKWDAWVSDEDYDKLFNMSDRNVYYRSDKEAFLADFDITMLDDYIGGGKLVSISVTKIFEEQEVVIN